jgi:putative tricarboxylic transport membrane protein
VEIFSQALPALMAVFAWPGPLYLVLGSLLGMLFGVLPGLGGPQVIALLLPITYGMNPSLAMVLLIGAMGAVPFGGSITAILINTPGTGQSAATCFDGFPLARQGKAQMAIAASATASCLGGIFGALILTVVLPIGKQIVLAFSYPEYFMLSVMGFSVISAVSGQSLWKGLFSACLGLLLSTIGYDPVTGASRFTFGIDYLWDGIKLAPAFIGLFAVSEALSLFLRRGKIAQVEYVHRGQGQILQGIKSIFQHFGLFIRSSIIGTIIGIIPGVGGATANFLAYGQAVQTGDHPERFGTGDIRGVIAPESANNAKDGGALVPTLIFGIPGGIETAILLGALIMLGLEPGPRMMLDNPEVVLVIIYTLVASNLLVSGIGIFAAAPLCRITFLPTTLLAPVIFMLALVGAYATENLVPDVVIAIFFGLLGYTMNRFRFSRIPLVLALVLGRLAQKTFHQTLMAWGVMGFFDRPISLGLFFATIALIAAPYLLAKRRRVR